MFKFKMKGGPKQYQHVTNYYYQHIKPRLAECRICFMQCLMSQLIRTYFMYPVSFIIIIYPHTKCNPMVENIFLISNQLIFHLWFCKSKASLHWFVRYAQKSYPIFVDKICFVDHSLSAYCSPIILCINIFVWYDGELV